MYRVRLLLPPLCLPSLGPIDGLRDIVLLDALGSDKENKARAMEAFQTGLEGVVGDCITWAKG